MSLSQLYDLYTCLARILDLWLQGAELYLDAENSPRTICYDDTRAHYAHATLTSPQKV